MWILRVYINKNNNALETARYFGLHHSTIQQYLKQIQKKALKTLKDMGLTIDDFKDFFLPQINSYIHQKATSVGFPSESYMNLPVGRSWKLKYGTKEYKANKTCMMPEFLEAADCHCICNICIDGNKCTRTDAYPENKEPEAVKHNELRIIDCIKNIQVQVKKMDLTKYERVAAI